MSKVQLEIPKLVGPGPDRDTLLSPDMICEFMKRQFSILNKLKSEGKMQSASCLGCNMRDSDGCFEMLWGYWQPKSHVGSDASLNLSALLEPAPPSRAKQEWMWAFNVIDIASGIKNFLWNICGKKRITASRGKNVAFHFKHI